MSTSLSYLHQQRGPLDSVESAAYEHAVLGSRLHADRPPPETGISRGEWAHACENLVRRRLLSRDEDGGLTAVHPDVALSILNAPLTDEIREREQAMAANSRVLQSIGRRLAENGRQHEGVRVVQGEKAIRDEIDSAILRCATEILSLRPGGPRSTDQFSASEASVTSIFVRGLRCQFVYHHTARANPGLTARAKAVAAYGGGIRTTAASFERLIIFDRRVAFVPVDAPGADHAAAVISDDLVVEYLHRTFTHLWANAVPLELAEDQMDEVSLGTRMAILRLMAAGLKDEAIANRLGMALRTCRRHISSILKGLQVSSRFQAGIRIAQLGILADEVADSDQSSRTDISPLW
ncbi:LuxR C-terminal-related transcriptional regulator [Verrucosispora sp. NA02020]|uniref:helix-turn-helix transcriptional regulator n=1 Tax=Verrucosispora sp. NA02020 TaxID=2742132 RepID=UPI0015927525|nr:LuxR C-terminal-related transcriptional regulator [Verrucosispora sp. NA02020]QKW16682.1 response regulator transcription factor [Verrucosispora sp. NA02020]